jgi:arylformamidase
MTLVDITGTLQPGMWHYPDPYPPFQMEMVPSPVLGSISTYSHVVSMSLHTGTFLETKAHFDPSAETIDKVGLDRLFAPAIVVHVPKGSRDHVALGDLDDALSRARLDVRPGDAVVIATGWGDRWGEPEFVDEGPHLTHDLVFGLIDRGVSILAGDIARFDDVDPSRSEHIFPELFDGGVLVLGPVVNLGRIPTTRGELIALPIKIKGASAAPCRAVFRY